MSKILTKMVLALVLALSVAEKSMAFDIVLLPINIVTGNPQEAFALTRSFPDLVESDPTRGIFSIFFLPFYVLKEGAPKASNIDDKQLKEFGYSEPEIAQIIADMNKLAKRNGAFRSKEEVLSFLSPATKSLYNLK